MAFPHGNVFCDLFSRRKNNSSLDWEWLYCHLLFRTRNMYVFLYPVLELEVFIRSKRFLWKSVKFLYYYRTCHLQAGMLWLLLLYHHLFPFYDSLCNVEVWSFYSCFLQEFYHAEMLSFVEGVMCISWDDHVISVLSLLNMLNILPYYLLTLKQHWIFRMMPAWLRHMNALICFWIWLLNFIEGVLSLFWSGKLVIMWAFGIELR